MATVDDKKAFSEEPEKLDEVEKAALVSDNGIATASLMKPQKPVRHHRGTNFYAVPDDEGCDEESCDTNSTVNEYKKSAWYIVSASIFVVASLLLFQSSSKV